MDSSLRTQISRRLVPIIRRPPIPERPGFQRSDRQQYRFSRRHASSSSSSSAKTPASKPVVLEKPDKFRPPSHPSRLKARSTTGSYGGIGAAYNQGMTTAEREASKTKRYPHMFPNEGTTMHWFLTTRWVHMTITLATLTFLAFISLTHTFVKTSPFAHLLPSVRSLPWHPIDYITETLSVLRLHMEYQTNLAAESRKQNILDAQKRRLYRRAHGMEDLDADEVSGPDVRGLVEWDDGLTNPERQRGGQYTPALIGSAMMEMGVKPGETFDELMERKRQEDADRKTRKADERRAKEELAQQLEVERLRRIQARGYREGEENGPPLSEGKRRRKVWLGIWG